MTFEDPVEIVVDGLNQSQIFPDIGYTFATGLRTALRQDPDIMMVGEIRDQETADVAIEASLTGHLVLSTIHTNSAAETLTRLINLGVKHFCFLQQSMLSSLSVSLRRINPEKAKRISFSELDINLQQRVKSVIATTPKEEIRVRLTDAIMKDPGFLIPDMTKSGESDQAYEGRIALYEVMEITAGIKDMIMREAPARDILAQPYVTAWSLSNKTELSVLSMSDYARRSLWCSKTRGLIIIFMSNQIIILSENLKHQSQKFKNMVGSYQWCYFDEPKVRLKDKVTFTDSLPRWWMQVSLSSKPWKSSVMNKKILSWKKSAGCHDTRYTLWS